MPIFFICFILFIMWFRVKSKQADKSQNSSKDFWTMEQAANFTRKQDISNLDYINVPYEKLPFNNTSDEEETFIQNELRNIMQRKILNLSGFTNTDLKLAYGAANLDLLTEYDQNFTLLIRTLNKWGVYLYNKEDKNRAKQIFEYSVSINSDIKETYTTLAKILLEEDNPKEVNELITTVNKSDFFMKDAISKSLTLLIQEYYL